MNRKIFLLLLVLGCYFHTTLIFAQKPEDRFGNVTTADLEMKSCSIDTAASAVVLFDIGETSFIQNESTLDVLYKRALRIKILKKAGIEYSTMDIPMYMNSSGGFRKDEIREMDAFTYNLIDGKTVKTKLDPKTVHEQKGSDYWGVKKIAFPDVHEGSVLEIRYEIRSPFKYILRDWDFQWEIPVIYSECILKYTPFYLYTYLLKNAGKFDEYSEYQDESLSKEFFGTRYKEGVCKFVMKNIPAFSETDFIHSKDEYLISLHFQLNKFTNARGVSEDMNTTWDDLAKDLTEDDNFGRFIASSQTISKQFLEDEKIAGRPVVDRFNAIVSWVKATFSWDGHHRMYAGNKVRELIKRKSGNSAEINLFLCGMLKAADIEAYPVLISTRGNERVIKDYPFLEFFNYVMVVAKVDDKWLLTDGTEPYCVNSSYPVRCINGKGLLVKGDKTSWVDISPKNFSSLEDRIRLKFNASMDSLDARFTIIAKGYEALGFRESIGDDHGKSVEYFTQNGIEAGDSVIIRNAGVDSVMKPYIIKLNGKIPVEISDQMLVVDPFCNMAIKRNPFDKETRKYPVDLIYPYTTTLLMELVIPEGYRINKTPESFSRDDDLMAFNYSSQLSENKIMLHAFYSIKDPVYAPEEYKQLKKFFDEIVKKLHEKIYLEKKS